VSVFIKIEGVYVLFKKTSGEVSVIFPIKEDSNPCERLEVVVISKKEFFW
jgi:hypothetical protein